MRVESFNFLIFLVYFIITLYSILYYEVMRRTEIFWLGLEALPREVRATEWRSWVKAPSDEGLLSRTWKTRRYQRAESQTPPL